jgi:hypothetical protein
VPTPHYTIIYPFILIFLYFYCYFLSFTLYSLYVDGTIFKNQHRSNDSQWKSNADRTLSNKNKHFQASDQLGYRKYPTSEEGIRFMTEPSRASELELAFTKLKMEFSSRSKTGIIRMYLHEIEAMKSIGIPNLKIVECLNHAGIDISLKVFESLLYRIRRRNKPSRNKPSQDKALPKLCRQEVRSSIRDPPTISIENQGDIRRALKEVINLEEYL